MSAALFLRSVSVPHSRPPADRPRPTDRPPPDRPACSLPLLARRGQEISHTISEAAEAAAGKAIFLSRPPPPLSVSSSENRFDGGKCRAKSLSARRVLRPFNALRNHIWSGGEGKGRTDAGGLMLNGRDGVREEEGGSSHAAVRLHAIPCHHWRCRRRRRQPGTGRRARL